MSQYERHRYGMRDYGYKPKEKNVHNPTSPCSCYVDQLRGNPPTLIEFRIVYCPTHAAALEMLEIVKAMFVNDGPAWDRAAEKARALLAQIEGKEGKS